MFGVYIWRLVVTLLLRDLPRLALTNSTPQPSAHHFSASGNISCGFIDSISVQSSAVQSNNCKVAGLIPDALLSSHIAEVQVTQTAQ